MTAKQRWVLALTSLPSLMIMLDALVVTTALNEIRVDLNASVEQLEWSVNAYTLTFAVLLMAGAALGERYGRKWTLMAGLVVFTLASVGCALAPGIGWLIAARALQGVGAAMVSPVAQAHLGEAFSPEERPKALGLFWAVTGMATLGGPILGGVIVSGSAWEWIFWLNIPIGLVLIPLIVSKLDESVGDVRRIDFVGVALVTIGAFGVVWSLVRGNEAGWTSIEVIAGFVVGALGLASFVRWELRTPNPLVPIRFFTSRAFAGGNLAIFLLFASTFVGLFFFAQFLQAVLGNDALGAGIRMAPWTVTVVLFAPISGILVKRFGERPLVATGLLLQAAASAWFAAIVSPDMAYSEMILPFVVAGAGTSMAVPSAMAVVFDSVPDSAFGPASGTFSSMRQLGGSFGVAISVAVFSSVGGYGSPKEFSDGFSAALVTASVIAVVGFAAGLLIPARQAAKQDLEKVPA